jgi:hypothetical protein
MGCCESSDGPSSGELDLGKDDANLQNLWVCDIAEVANEPDCDFLFQADINADGNVELSRNSMKMTSGRRVCIFQSVMYDVNSFTPDLEFDGRLDFKIRFGSNTFERQDAPQGWEVAFKNLVFQDKRYKGTIATSWWGDRGVTLIAYKDLTTAERSKYPDLKATYYRSRGAANVVSANAI